MSALTIATVDAGGDRLDEIHRDILVPSFTSEELVAVDVLRSGIQDGEMTMLAALDDGVPVGAAVTDGGASSDVHLLAYLATRADLRSAGVGTALMRTLLDRWAAPDGPALVLAEVHDPDHWATTEAEQPVARWRFYARLGATRLPFTWVQPRIEPHLDRVDGMALLVLHARPPLLVGPDAVDRGAVVRWVIAAQDHAEGPTAGEDPQLAAVRAAALAAPDPMPLAVLSDP